jgi:GNAT superfamily N-acetyltransferase
MAFEVFTLKERPDLRSGIFAAAFQPPFFPEFMVYDRTAQLYFSAPFFDAYLEFAFAATDAGEVVARAFSVPFAFNIEERHELPDGGWDEVIRWAHEDRALGRKANAVSALEISLLPRVRGRGNARRMLDAMRQNACTLGFRDLYAPVRPTQKAHQPFVSMSEYAAMRRSDGLPQDPWLRTHFQIGGSTMKIAPYAMTIVGTIAEWSAWTGVIFERSGLVAVDGALSPVHVSLEQNHAVYVEPNIWVHHRL